MRPAKPIILVFAVAFVTAIILLASGNYLSFTKLMGLPHNLPLSNVEGPTDEWKTYRYEQYGFSFDYPPEWRRFGQEESDKEHDGISVNTFTVRECTNSADYIEKQIEPVFTNAQIRPLNINGLDGFIVENQHLYSEEPGPEAYIINCPYGLRIGYSSEEADGGDEVFEKILSSVSVWKPEY